MFTFMWRVKRAHYMVLKMWRGLKLLHKEVNKIIPGTCKLDICHFLIYFIEQHFYLGMNVEEGFQLHTCIFWVKFITSAISYNFSFIRYSVVLWRF